MNRFINLAILLVVSAVMLAGIEVFLRWTGHHPYRTPTAAALPVVEPGGRMYEKDDDVGYRNLPGHFATTLPGGWKYSATNDEHGHRITHAASEPPRASQAWFFGCSFTYGWGINDEDTFAWKIRHAGGTVDVVNYGVPGYGTLQGLIQFRKALESGQRPKFVAIVYGSFHDERNAALRFRIREMAPLVRLGSVNYPYARIRFGKLVTYMGRFEYTPWPLQKDLATVELLEDAYTKNEDVFVGSQEISKAIIQEFKTLASSHSIPVVLFGILNNKRTREVVAYAKTIGVIAADVSEELRTPESVVPGDAHPSALTNDKYAAKMIAVLQQNGLF